MKTILLVEDDKLIIQALEPYLKDSGFTVVVAETLEYAKKHVNNTDLILLDWMLPDGQGIDFLRTLRTEKPDMPVVMLTARSDLTDRVLGLELGADDYITKPFEPRELLARIRARLRQGSEAVVERLSCAGIEADLKTREVFFKGKTIVLKKLEFDLLCFFLNNPDRVLSRDSILEKVWKMNYCSTRTVDVHVMHLRQKFGQKLFATVHGVGYRFIPGSGG